MVTRLQVSGVDHANQVSIQSNVWRGLKVDTELNMIEDGVVGNVEVVAWKGQYSISIAMMNGWVGHLRVGAVCHFESKCGCISAILGAVVDLNLVKKSVTESPGSISFHEIVGDELASPMLSVVSGNLNVSSEKHNFSSDVNSVILCSSWHGGSKVSVANCSVKIYLTSLDVVSCNNSVVCLCVISSSWEKTDIVSSCPVKTLLNKDACWAWNSCLEESWESASWLAVHLN